MLLSLLVLEFEDLHAIWESCLCCFSLCKEIADLASLKALLNIIVLEENHLVAIWPNLPLDTVGENDFFLTVVIDSLDLTFLTYIFFHQFCGF